METLGVGTLGVGTLGEETLGVGGWGAVGGGFLLSHSVPESTLPPTRGPTCGRIFAATRMAAFLGPGATPHPLLCGGKSAASPCAVSGGGHGPWVCAGWQRRAGIEMPVPSDRG